MIDYFITHAPLWIKLFSEACTKEPLILTNNVWPPVDVAININFWQKTIIETSITIAAFFSAIGAYFLWIQKAQPILIARLLGLQIVFLCTIIGLGLKIFYGAEFSFALDSFYSSNFFMWLGNLSLFVASAIILAITTGLIAKFSDKRLLQGSLFLTNVLATGVVLSGWVLLIYAQSYCSL